MGTHPIFESDFDCLTGCRIEMEEAKQLVVIVDRTASMAPYWNSIAKFYLAPIVKQLCRANKIASGYLSNTLHSVITYGAGDEFGGALNSIKSSNPTFKSHDFIRYFDS